MPKIPIFTGYLLSSLFLKIPYAEKYMKLAIKIIPDNCQMGFYAKYQGDWTVNDMFLAKAVKLFIFHFKFIQTDLTGTNYDFKSY